MKAETRAQCAAEKTSCIDAKYFNISTVSIITIKNINSLNIYMKSNHSFLNEYCMFLVQA